jgi:ribosomal protein S8
LVFFLDTGAARGSILYCMNLLVDMISRIRVGYITRRSVVKVKYSKFCFNIINVLLKEGFICGYEFTGNKFLIFLRYISGQPIIRYISVISTPRKLTYMGRRSLLNWNSGGCVFISTKVGVLSKDKALGYNIGGIVLFRIN